MWLEINNLHAKVLRETEEERSWLADYLSFPDESAGFRKRMPVWKRGDGKIHMLSATTGTFPAGFATQVKKAAKEDGIDVRLLDRRKNPCQPDLRAAIDWLRDYQTEAIGVAKSVARGVFHHATGAGKTEIAVALTEVYPIKWLFLTHRKDLIVQTADRFARRTGEEVGSIGEGVFKPARVTVAMFQTLYRRLISRDKATLHFLSGVQGVLVDECHVLPAATFWRVLMALPNAYYRFGFSGTPFSRGDKKSIYTWGALGPVIHRIPAKLLIEKGVLARPKIKMLVQKHPGVVGTWAEVYEQLIVSSPTRNATVAQAVQRATKPSLVFVNHVRHGRLLEDMIRSKGTSVEFVWGTHHTRVRQAAIERLVLGQTDVLICNVIFQEGIDIPELQSVVIAQGGKSIIAALQRLGRGMRKRSKSGKVTKETFEVFDVKDKGCGCVGRRKHAGCRWMEKHTRGRLRAYASEQHEVIEESPVARGRSKTHTGRA